MRTKNILRLCLISFIAFPLQSIAQWENVSPSNTDSVILFDVEFANDDLGFAVGQDLVEKSGVIYKTKDGGSTWTKKTFATHHLRAIAIFEGEKVLVSGYDAVPGSEVKWLTSSDMGETWDENSDNRFTGINGLRFVDQNKGYAFGYGSNFGFTGGIMSTNDGGASWNTIYNESGVLVESMSMIDANTGFMAGVSMTGDGTVYKTTDGAQNFTPIFTGGWLSDIQFLDADLGYAVEGLLDKSLIKTTDGGSNWSSTDLDDDVSYITFLTADDGYGIGKEGAIVKTEDGGQSWTDESINITDDFNGLGTTHKYIYVCGDNGVVYRAAHDLFTAVPKLFGDAKKMEVFPNPAHSNETLHFSGLSNDTYTFELFNMKGQRMVKSELIKEKVDLVGYGLETGLYTYVITGNLERHTGKIILK